MVPSTTVGSDRIQVERPEFKLADPATHPALPLHRAPNIW
jgi:hypothetical protein